MARLIIISCVALVVASCGATVEETTTTALQATSTTVAETTTTTQATSTTVAETTTTTQATTTTTLLEGNWADVPLVVSKFGALGWWDGANWIQVDELTELPVSGGEDYRVVLFGSDAIVTGGPETILCEPVFNVGVELDDPDALGGGWPSPTGVAISAPWPLVPHFVQVEEDDDGTYAEFARPLLAARGLEVESPVISQVVRFDLEGDGINEVIAVAQSISNEGSLFAEEGDYSLAFLRRVVDGEVQTAVLGESIVDADQAPYIIAHAVAAIADLSGDGKMEIVLHEAYYEGSGWGVWEYVNDDLGPVQQLGGGCGV